MGRYLACGIPVGISVYGILKIDESDIVTIKKNISKYVNLDLYDERKYDDGFYYRIKPNIFDNNIHNTIKEIYPILNCQTFLEYLFGSSDINIKSKAFCKGNYPINLKREKNGSLGEHVESKRNRIDTINYMDGSKWMFKDERLTFCYELEIDYVLLWKDKNEYNLKDNGQILNVLNDMKCSYYKSGNELSKNLMYFVI